jgi:hypothetical protein
LASVTSFTNMAQVLLVLGKSEKRARQEI